MENYVGKRIDGRYEILEIIGVGGMAVVYKAYDNIDGKTVAVKVLKNEFSNDEDTLRRFRNESKAIAALDHQNIVKIFDVSFGNLIQYIVMEYVEGITLKEYIHQQGKLNSREALYYITQILRALQHAHDKGIIHRDIKPQNIMLMSDGTIKVTDFGIARMSRSETKTLSTDAVGSIHYISPEQIKGGITDAKSDIYSVGIVLYEMLTGQLPFDADNTPQVIFMQVEQEPKKPREIEPTIDIGLEQIILRAMQKNKSLRYQSASEMLADIEIISRNPNARFNYNHFVDQQPTQKISKDSYNQQAGGRPYVPQHSASSTQTATRTRTAGPRRAMDPRMKAEIDKKLENEKKQTKKIIIILVVVLVLLVAAGIGVYMVYQGSASKVDVPNLVGKNYTRDVMNNSEYNMFKFEVVNEANDALEEGQILSQNPEDGRVDRGSTIVLHVVMSDDKVTVPDVYGSDATTAETTLKAKNFTVKIEKQQSSSVEEGKVIKTSPAKGEEVDSGSTVTIYVSSGAEGSTVQVPNLSGMTLEQAREALEAVGLELDSANVEYERSSSVEKGQVISYDNRGETVDKGTAIAVVISSGDGETTVSTTESTTESTTRATTTESTTRATTTESTTRATTTTETTTESTTKATTTESTTKATTTEATTADDSGDDDLVLE